MIYYYSVTNMAEFRKDPEVYSMCGLTWNYLLLQISQTEWKSFQRGHTPCSPWKGWKNFSFNDQFLCKCLARSLIYHFPLVAEIKRELFIVYFLPVDVWPAFLASWGLAYNLYTLSFCSNPDIGGGVAICIHLHFFRRKVHLWIPPPNPSSFLIPYCVSLYADLRGTYRWGGVKKIEGKMSLFMDN